MSERTRGIFKELSRNDSGETGGHQAGILIPKVDSVLAFFPPLDTGKLNPRHHILFEDDSGDRWTFAFIYYNNRKFGGTRDEYRLTRMTPFMRANNLRAGDTLLLRREGHRYRISIKRRNAQHGNVLKLGGSWRVIPIR